MIAREFVAGTNQYDAMIDAYAGASGWDELPSTPPVELRAAGRYVKLVSSVEGTLRRVRHTRKVRSLPSVARFEPTAKRRGDDVPLTLDLASAAGRPHAVGSHQ